MGHQRLGTLPATKKWEQVVALLSGGADAAIIAAAVADAAEASLRRASRDAALCHAFWLLTQIPLAARTPNFGQSLQALGLSVSAAPTLVEICSAVMAAVDDTAHSTAGANDLSEMATKAAVESLIAVAGREATDLFGPAYAADAAQAALYRLAAERQFALLTRDFVARLTRHCLDYFLSRTIADHVGANKRFLSIRDHHQFEAAITLHCRETARIVEDFGGAWFSKTNYEGGITRKKAGDFIYVAFEKVRSELRVRHAVHG